MIYADALKGIANGQTNTALFEESIGVCEVVLEGASSQLVTLKLYHSVGGTLPAGSYFIGFENVDNATATGVYTITWEELIP